MENDVEISTALKGFSHMTFTKKEKKTETGNKRKKANALHQVFSF